MILYPVSFDSGRGEGMVCPRLSVSMIMDKIYVGYHFAQDLLRSDGLECVV